MKIKKILAAIAAAAISASAMAVNVFAAEVEGPSKEFTVSVNDKEVEGYLEKGILAITSSDIPEGTTEIKFDISFSGNGAYGGGAIGRNVGGSWKQDDTGFDNNGNTHITINPAEMDKGTEIQVQCWWVGGGAMIVKTTFITDAPDEAGDADDSASEASAPIYIPTADTVPSGPAVVTVSSSAQITTSRNSNVSVDASATKVTPAMVTAFTKNKKAQTLTLNYDSKVKIVIGKNDVEAADSLAKADFSTTGKNFIKAADVAKNEKLAKASKVVQVGFNSTKKLDGVSKVTVQSRVGAVYAGKEATVYEYVNGKLVKVAVTKVGNTGLASFKVDHLGQYVIAVD